MDQQKRRDMLKQTGARITPVRGLPVVTDFGDPTGEYHAARDAVAVYPALERGTVRIAGRDRIDWLHNLITQNVKTLQVGQGAYSFALDPKGRIQMDLNVFKTDDNLRLDLDRRCITQALEYFDRYIFAEDVSITDRTADFDRIALLGPRLKDLAEKLALPSVGHMPPLTFTTIEMAGQPVLAVRHDFAAVPGLELHVPSSHTPAC
jgi:glycine cleavage system aminomethyltransferase T